MPCENVLHTALPSVRYAEGDQMQTKFCASHWVSEHKYEMSDDLTNMKH